MYDQANVCNAIGYSADAHHNLAECSRILSRLLNLRDVEDADDTLRRMRICAQASQAALTAMQMHIRDNGYDAALDASF